jgi:hypothetical protein
MPKNDSVSLPATLPAAELDEVQVDELRRFIGWRLQEDWNTARQAGHGYGHLPRGSEPAWTRLDLTDNVRPSYDTRFISRFNPDAVAEDVVRKAELAAVADIPTLLLLASEWEDHRNFRPEWSRPKLNGREGSDLLQALHGEL